MSRCLQEWGCLPRSRPKLLMTGSNWEVEDGAEPSLVNNSSSAFLFFGQLSIGLVARPPPRFAWGWLKSSRHRVKSLGPDLARHAVRQPASKDDVLRFSLHVLCTGPHHCHRRTAPTTCYANACAASKPRWSVKTPSAPTPQGSRPAPTPGAAARSPSCTTTCSLRCVSTPSQ